ncbi:Mediator of RNA polymerase II transcription subunit 23 [Rhizoctonia solani]|uniref:Mediator of RNA polymerase II transcription subunit 23 n=1 Tax=Rhizoctonia solani TaxID=456999 RepID=A0A0K6G3V3_9AGAM|nr:Mediator of RNA polymerase II transcription subunit 23 [Rhizoctonia solani]
MSIGNIILGNCYCLYRFAIESSQSLQPDNAAITASAIMEIAKILQNRTLDNPQEPSNLDSPNNFRPSTSAFIINFVWFLSLCMSITVALLAGLVKQWCNTLLWDRTAPPCNQARIRQARFNGLMLWQMELVIFALPIIMDAALGLFLLGLLVFLQDLSVIIFLASSTVTLLTATFYFGTTLAPCFFPFCPYETAITSPKVWGFCYQLFLAIILWVGKNIRGFDAGVKADLTNHMSPAGKKEKEMTSNTTPDQLTGDALNWIILHSQKPEPRKMAIRAIATLDSDSEMTLKRLVSAPPGILPQVIQSFTSCFLVNSINNGVIKFEFKKLIDPNLASLYGRALTVLVTQILQVSDSECKAQNNDVELGLSLSKWEVSSNAKEEVKTRFEYLANTKNTETRAWALIGLSIWHEFIGFTGGLRFNQGRTIYELTDSLENLDRLSSTLRKEVLRALIREITYWTPNVSNDCRKGVLSHLINLIPIAPPSEQPQLACALAVLTLNLNHGTSYPLVSDDGNALSGISGRDESGDKLAKLLMSYYASGLGNLIADEHPLLLFALTGLMDYYEHCDFNDEVHRNMKKIAKRLQGFDSLGKLRSVKIPVSIDGVTFKTILIDLRTYFIDTLLSYLRLPRTPQYTLDIDRILACLLKSINPKRQSWDLEEYGPQIVPLVTQILIQTEEFDLQIECINTIISYWDSGPSLLYSRMQLSCVVPPKLLEILDDNPPAVRSTLEPKISFILQKMGEQAKHFTPTNDNETLATCMDIIMREDLFKALVKCVHVPEQTEFNPQISNESESNSISLLQSVREYLQDRNAENGELLLKKMIEAYTLDLRNRTSKHLMQC